MFPRLAERNAVIDLSLGPMSVITIWGSDVTLYWTATLDSVSVGSLSTLRMLRWSAPMPVNPRSVTRSTSNNGSVWLR